MNAAGSHFTTVTTLCAATASRQGSRGSPPISKRKRRQRYPVPGGRGPSHRRQHHGQHQDFLGASPCCKVPRHDRWSLAIDVPAVFPEEARTARSEGNGNAERRLDVSTPPKRRFHRKPICVGLPPK